MLSVPSTSAVPARPGRSVSGNAVAIIIAAFIGAVLFTLGAGAVLYLNTQKLTAAAERVQHTQEALSSLQRASLLAKLARRHGLAGLSMGMSADYESAVMLGATHVRVGTALFGPRTA